MTGPTVLQRINPFASIVDLVTKCEVYWYSEGFAPGSPSALISERSKVLELSLIDEAHDKGM